MKVLSTVKQTLTWKYVFVPKEKSFFAALEIVSETAEEVSSSCVFLIYTGYTQIGRCSALVVDMLPKNPDSLEMHHYTGIFQCSDAFFFLCTVQ